MEEFDDQCAVRFEMLDRELNRQLNQIGNTRRVCRLVPNSMGIYFLNMPTNRGKRRAGRQSSLRVRVFKNGGSQAIRIPKAFRVDAEEVTIRKVGESLIVEPVYAEWGAAFSKMFFEDRRLEATFPEREQPEWLDWKAGR